MIKKQILKTIYYLEEINLPDNLNFLPTEVFSYTAIENINLKNIEKIGELAFCECANLKTINLEKIKIIEQNAFNDCYKLEEIVLKQTQVQHIV